LRQRKPRPLPAGGRAIAYGKIEAHVLQRCDLMVTARNPSPFWGGSAERSGGRGGGHPECLRCSPPPDRPNGRPPRERASLVSTPQGGGISKSCRDSSFHSYAIALPQGEGSAAFAEPLSMNSNNSSSQLHLFPHAGRGRHRRDVSPDMIRTSKSLNAFRFQRLWWERWKASAEYSDAAANH
jgi:hypothetical protein